MIDMLRLIQLQTELVTELPEALAELTRAIRGLADVVESTKETVASANRVIGRLETLVDELEDPLRGLKPGIERVNDVLDAPAMHRLQRLLSRNR